MTAANESAVRNQRFISCGLLSFYSRRQRAFGESPQRVTRSQLCKSGASGETGLETAADASAISRRNAPSIDLDPRCPGEPSARDPSPQSLHDALLDRRPAPRPLIRDRHEHITRDAPHLEAGGA